MRWIIDYSSMLSQHASNPLLFVNMYAMHCTHTYTYIINCDCDCATYFALLVGHCRRFIFALYSRRQKTKATWQLIDACQQFAPAKNVNKLSSDQRIWICLNAWGGQVVIQLPQSADWLSLSLSLSCCLSFCLCPEGNYLKLWFKVFLNFVYLSF